MFTSLLNDCISFNGLENVKQPAHVSNHSTETALLSIKNEVHLARARSKDTALVLFDQSAAYDTIDHGMLLDCLSSRVGVCFAVVD